MAHHAKHVFRWDLDKTYLRTEFHTMRDMLRSAFESASDKQAFPGATALLRLLRNDIEHRICIVSGSPSQMRKVLTAKLALDGVEYDEFVLKNNLRNLVRGRFKAMRAQIPYKLPVLLESRIATSGTPGETLFGDDAEADAIVYSLYADIISGRVHKDTLYRIMQAARSYPDEIERSLALAEQVQKCESVQRIFIHLEDKSPTARFAEFGSRLVPIYNYFQAALLFYADGLLSARQVAFVGREMFDSPEYDLASLANSLQNLILRGYISRDTAARLALDLQSDGLSENFSENKGPPIEGLAWAFAHRVRQLGDAKTRNWSNQPPNLDYVAMVDAEYRARHT